MIKVQILKNKCNAEYYFISLSQRGGGLEASHAALLILTSK